MTNYLDTRDLYKRQCELQEELDDLESERDDMRGSLDDAQAEYREAEDAEDLDRATERIDDYIARVEDAEKALADWLEDNKEELDALNDLENEVGNEWMHGATLIYEDDFKEYAQELASDLNGRECDPPWPFNCIDWDQAADELRMDYTEVDFQGTTYLFRS